jgi:hypothetical protein
MEGRVKVWVKQLLGWFGWVRVGSGETTHLTSRSIHIPLTITSYPTVDSDLIMQTFYHGPIKHGCIPPTLQKETDHVVAIAKNPYPWLVSMFNRPYG